MGAKSPFREFSARPNHAEYEPGDVVEGRVVLNLSQDIQLEWLNLLLHGSCIVHPEILPTKSDFCEPWSDQDGVFQEVYLNHCVCLWGNEKKSSTEKLPKGQHYFPFSLTLPNNIPTNFRAKHGLVTYKLEATLCQVEEYNGINDKKEIDGKQSKGNKHSTVYHTESQLTVRQPAVLQINISNKGKSQGPQKSYSSKNLKLDCLIRLNSLYHVVGDEILVDIGVENGAQHDSPIISLLLTQIIVYHTADIRRYKIERNDIIQNTFGKIPSKSYIIWKNQKFPLPTSLPPSDLCHCSLVDVQYLLRLMLDKTNDVLNIPIRIMTSGKSRGESTFNHDESTCNNVNDNNINKVKKKTKKSFLERKLDHIEDSNVKATTSNSNTCNIHTNDESEA